MQDMCLPYPASPTPLGYPYSRTPTPTLSLTPTPTPTGAGAAVPRRAVPRHAGRSPRGAPCAALRLRAALAALADEQRPEGRLGLC